jgi:site-specific DNA recombinase
MKVVAYIRVSTEEQVKNGQGLEIQREEIEKYVKQKGLTLVKIFEDAGVSGANDITRRKGLNELLEYVKENPIDQVLVTKMDRLARDVFIQLWVEKELSVYDVNIVSINEDNLNGNDYMTVAMRQMVAVFAQLEKNRITDRLIGGRRKKASKGVKASGNCPIGYKYQKNSQGKSIQVVIDEKTAPIVKNIFSLYLKGYSLKEIADKLNAEGFRTQRGNVFTKKAIHDILKNDFYTGVVTFDGVKTKGSHEPIISKITFGKVQSLLAKNRKKV